MEPDALAKLEPADLARLRHLLGCAVAVAGVAGLLAVENLDVLWSAAALAGTLAALLFPRRLAGAGERAWRIAGRLVVAYACCDLVWAGTQPKDALVPAVVRVALAITVLRAMQGRRRRDDLQLLLLAMFLAAAGGALSLSPLFAVQVFLFVPLAGALLFLVNHAAEEPGAPPPDARWASFTWGDFFARLRPACSWRVGGFLAGLLVAVVGCATLIFVTLPRFHFDQAIPFELPGKSRTGFSDSVTLGGTGSMSEDTTVAMRVDTPGRRRPGANPYWRMIALDRYVGTEAESRFSLSPGAEPLFDSTGRGTTWSLTEPPRTGGAPAFLRGEWTVHFEGNVSRYLPIPGALSEIRFEKHQEWNESRPLRVIRLERTPGASLHMRMLALDDLESHSPTRLESNRLRLKLGLPSGYPSTLVATSEDPASRAALAAMVAEIGGAGDSPVAFAARAGDWLATRHAYARTDGYGVKTARPGEPKDYLVRWMRSGATGWCEHFASSLVLLARTAGYPARLVTGFSGGEWNESDRYLVVRMKHAHAWCELYDPDAKMWRRVDPTPVGAGGDGAGDQAEARADIRSFTGLAAWYDSMTMLWFRRVINFEDTDRQALEDGVLEKFKTWRAGLSAWVRETAAGLWNDLKKTPATAGAWAAGVAVAIGLAAYARRRFARWRLTTARRTGEESAVVRAHRRRAGAWLRRLDARGGPAAAEVRAAVESIRYGRPSDWGDPDRVFAAARAALRASRRAK